MTNKPIFFESVPVMNTTINFQLKIHLNNIDSQDFLRIFSELKDKDFENQSSTKSNLQIGNFPFEDSNNKTSVVSQPKFEIISLKPHIENSQIQTPNANHFQYLSDTNSLKSDNRFISTNSQNINDELTPSLIDSSKVSKILDQKTRKESEISKQEDKSSTTFFQKEKLSFKKTIKKIKRKWYLGPGARHLSTFVRMHVSKKSFLSSRNVVNCETILRGNVTNPQV